MSFRDGGTNGGNGVSIIVLNLVKVTLRKDDELFHIIALNSEGRNGGRPDLGRGVSNRVLDVLRIVVTAGDDDEVLESAGDVDLVVDDDGQVAGGQPLGVGRRAGSPGILSQRGHQGIMERLFGFLGAIQVAGGNVSAITPQLTHGTVGNLGAGFGVNNRKKLRTHHLAVGGKRHRILIARNHHAASLGQRLPIKIVNQGTIRGLWRRDQQRRLSQAVGGAHRSPMQPMLRKRRNEGLHGLFGHRLGTQNQAIHLGQIQIRAGGRQPVAHGQIHGKVRNNRIHVFALMLRVQLVHPPGRLLDEIAGRHQVHVQAENGHKGGQDDAHVVVQRQPGDQPEGGLQLGGGENLQHVGENGPVGQHHAGRHPGGAGSVLQEGGQVHRQLATSSQELLGGRVFQGVSKAFSQGVRQGIHRQHAGPLPAGNVGEERPHRTGGPGIGEHSLGGGVRNHRLEVVGVAGLIGVIQRHRHHAGIHGPQHCEHIFGGVIGKDGHPVANGAHLLQPSRNSLNAGIDLVTGVFHDFPIAGLREIPESQGLSTSGAGRLLRLVKDFAHAGERHLRLEGDLTFLVEELADNRM